MKRFVLWMAALCLLTLASCENSPKVQGNDVRLTTQSQVNSYRGGAYVEMLVLNGEDITDLSGLKISNVGTLVIQHTSVAELVLPALTTVGKELTIENNIKLKSLSDLTGLTTVGGSLLLNNNPRLGDISGLLHLTRVAGLLSITNNLTLGEDKPFEGGDDYTYGLLPVKYLSEHNVLEGGVKLVNNHPLSAATPEAIGTGGQGNWGDFIIDSEAAAEAFELEGNTVMNLTVKGSEITNDVLFELTKKGLRCVKGTMTVEGTKITTTEGFFDVVRCEGGIVLKDNQPGRRINTNGLRYYSRIGGDLVIDNSSLEFWTEGSSFADITEIAGDFTVANCDDFNSGAGFQSLLKVNGDVLITQCNNLYSLGGMKIETIGGNLLLVENQKFNGLGGLEAIKAIGGTIHVKGAIPDYGEVGRPGWCMVKRWIENNILTDTENMRLQHQNDSAVDIESIGACDGYNPGGGMEPKSYEIAGLSELETFTSVIPTDKETVINLTITGTDVTDDMLSRVQNRVATITGTVTWDGFGEKVTTTEHFFDKIDCQGSIIIRNCPKIGNPNGFEKYTTLKGSFIIENCPSMATAASGGWDDHCWSFLEHVGGTVRLQGLRSQLGGAAFKRLKTVGGSFEIIDCGGSFWDLNAMPLASIGGDLIITNNPSFENLKGLDKLSIIGGDVTIFDNPKVPTTSDWAVGYCLIKDYKTKGIIKSDAIITLGTTEHPIDIKNVPSCGGSDEPLSYTLAGRTMVAAFVDGTFTNKETVKDLTITGADVSNDEMGRIRDRVGKITGTVTWEGLGVTTTLNFFNAIDCQGGIVIRNCLKLDNPNGFEPLKTVHGDFILENCPELVTPGTPGWAEHGWWFLETVEGTFRLKGIKKQMGANDTFHNLKTVGGNFEVIECSDAFWNFQGMPLTTIGGDLIVTGNPNLENLMGLDKLTSIGGNVTIMNNPKVPSESNDWAIGLCIFKYYKNNGITNPGAVFTLGTTDNPINVDDLIPHSGTVK